MPSEAVSSVPSPPNDDYVVSSRFTMDMVDAPGDPPPDLQDDVPFAMSSGEGGGTQGANALKHSEMKEMMEMGIDVTNSISAGSGMVTGQSPVGEMPGQLAMSTEIPAGPPGIAIGGGGNGGRGGDYLLSTSHVGQSGVPVPDITGDHTVYNGQRDESKADPSSARPSQSALSQTQGEVPALATSAGDNPMKVRSPKSPGSRLVTFPNVPKAPAVPRLRQTASTDSMNQKDGKGEAKQSGRKPVFIFQQVRSQDMDSRPDLQGPDIAPTRSYDGREGTGVVPTASHDGRQKAGGGWAKIKEQHITHEARGEQLEGDLEKLGQKKGGDALCELVAVHRMKESSKGQSPRGVARGKKLAKVAGTINALNKMGVIQVADPVEDAVSNDEDDAEPRPAKPARRRDSTLNKVANAVSSIPTLTPDSVGRRAWDLTMLATASFHALVVPLILVKQFAFETELAAIHLVLLPMYLADVVVKLNTALASPTKDKLVSTRSAIVEEYLRRHLLIDILSILPFDSAAYLSGATSTPLRAAVALRLLRIIPVSSLFNISNTGTMTVEYVDFYFNTVPIIRSTFNTFVILHFLFCLKLALPSDQEAAAERGRYDYAMFWVVSVFCRPFYHTSKVYGYGQLWYAMLISMSSFLGTGAVVGKVSFILLKSSMKEQNSRKMKATLDIIRTYSIPRSLQQEVLSFQWHSLHSSLNALTNTGAILEKLPAQMRNEIGLHIRVDFVRRVPLFICADDATTVALATALKSVCFAAGEIVIEAGEVGMEMYFTLHGSCEVLVGPSPGIVVAQLNRGDFFGEVALLVDVPRTATIRTLTYCDFFRLVKHDFNKICELNPAFRAEMEKTLEEKLPKDYKTKNKRLSSVADGLIVSPMHLTVEDGDHDLLEESGCLPTGLAQSVRTADVDGRDATGARLSDSGDVNTSANLLNVIEQNRQNRMKVRSMPAALRLQMPTMATIRSFRNPAPRSRPPSEQGDERSDQGGDGEKIDREESQPLVGDAAPPSPTNRRAASRRTSPRLPPDQPDRRVSPAAVAVARAHSRGGGCDSPRDRPGSPAHLAAFGGGPGSQRGSREMGRDGKGADVTASNLSERAAEAPEPSPRVSQPGAGGEAEAQTQEQQPPPPPATGGGQIGVCDPPPSRRRRSMRRGTTTSNEGGGDEPPQTQSLQPSSVMRRSIRKEKTATTDGTLQPDEPEDAVSLARRGSPYALEKSTRARGSVVRRASLTPPVGHGGVGDEDADGASFAPQLRSPRRHQSGRSFGVRDKEDEIASPRSARSPHGSRFERNQSLAASAGGAFGQQGTTSSFRVIAGFASGLHQPSPRADDDVASVRTGRNKSLRVQVRGDGDGDRDRGKPKPAASSKDRKLLDKELLGMSQEDKLNLIARKMYDLSEKIESMEDMQQQRQKRVERRVEELQGNICNALEQALVQVSSHVMAGMQAVHGEVVGLADIVENEMLQRLEQQKRYEEERERTSVDFGRQNTGMSRCGTGYDPYAPVPARHHAGSTRDLRGRTATRGHDPGTIPNMIDDQMGTFTQQAFADLLS